MLYWPILQSSHYTSRAGSQHPWVPWTCSIGVMARWQVGKHFARCTLGAEFWPTEIRQDFYSSWLFILFFSVCVNIQWKCVLVLFCRWKIKSRVSWKQWLYNIVMIQTSRILSTGFRKNGLDYCYVLFFAVIWL